MRRRLIWGITALVDSARARLTRTVRDRHRSIAQDPRRRDRSGGLRRPSIERGAQARSGGERPACQPHRSAGGSTARARRAARPDRRCRRRSTAWPISRVVSPGDPTGALGVTHHLAAVNVHMAFYDRAGVALDPPRRLRSLDDATARRCRRLRPEGGLRPVPAAVRPGVRLREQHAELPVRRRDPGGIGGRHRRTGACSTCPAIRSRSNGKQLADYPMVGFTEDRVTLTTNQFDYTNAPFVGGFKYVQVVSFPKGKLYDCSVPVVPIKIFSRIQTRDPDGSRAFTIVPALSFGGAPTTQFMTSLDFNGSTGKLILWRLKVGARCPEADAGSAGRRGDGLSPAGGGNAGTPRASTTKWDTGDLRLTSSFWDGVARTPVHDHGDPRGTSVAAPWSR